MERNKRKNKAAMQLPPDRWLGSGWTPALLSASQQAVSMRNASTVFTRLKRTNCSERLLFLGLKADGRFGQGSVRHSLTLLFYREETEAEW